MSLAVVPVVLLGAVLALAACGKGQGASSPLTDAGADAGADSGADVPPNRFPCLDSRPVAGGGGFVECQGGWFARPNGAACQTGGATP